MRIVVGVTGGIAAYKATAIIRQLTEAGHSVKVIPTQNALRFIGATTLEALSHNAVDPDLYTDVADVKHVALGQEADLVLVAPATASFIARFAAGLADDLLGNVLLASKAPVVIAPAMHTEMWQHPATVANVATLRARGVQVIEPASGRLTGDDSGPGRLPEPEVIVSEVLSTMSPKDLLGKRIVVTAGGTIEPIDPVRFIGNRSSGKQGIALAQQAKLRGASVTLIAANLDTVPVELVDTVTVETAAQLNEAVMATLPAADVLIMAAAVSDFRVTSPSSSKLKKSDLGDHMQIELVANPDILKQATIEIADRGLKVVTVGFAAETEPDPSTLLKIAGQKLVQKGCDLLVANDVSNGAVFGSEHNSVLILDDQKSALAHSGNKSFIADRILDAVVERLN
jgi:phosphopantothenoylcysteine decarboxylase/phosphopantothenate--cysteine ligase